MDLDEVIREDPTPTPRPTVKPIREEHRFFLLCIGCISLLVTSFAYAYNLFSDFLMNMLHTDQSGLAAISTTGTVLAYVTLPYAFLYDYLGPIPVACCGTFFVSLGALLYALSFQGYIHGTVVRMAVINAIMCHGTMLYDLACCVTVLSHFPTLRGVTVALLKCYVGLGSSIIGCIRLGLFPVPQNFFYFLFAYALFAGGLIIAFIRLPRYHMTGYQLRHSTVEEQEERAAAKAPYLHQKPERWRIIVGYVIIVLFIIFLPTQSAVINYLSLGKKYKRGFAIATVSLLASNVVLFLPTPPCWRNKKKNNEKKEEITEELGWTGEAAVTEIPAGEVVVKEIEAPEGELLSDRNKEEEGSDSNKESDVDFMAPQYQTSFRQNLLTLRLWCIAWTLFCLGGTEFVIINNPSYIYSAMARVETDTNMRTLLSVVSGVGSAVGRLFMAAFEHVSQHRPPEKRIPITWAPFIPMTLMTITLILFLTCPARLTPPPHRADFLCQWRPVGAYHLATTCHLRQGPRPSLQFLFRASGVFYYSLCALFVGHVV
ncbi:Nodulin-like, putative [Angomonas deanei]|uniref:Nodulin-like, putative n=1 Tax=Angomonas deanei TaxID=59799 RepID=A0A7G2CQK2_9TRYP|nr:Nodulin-like, putative [Angomonas deanei]